jgi:hypothetical protein
MVSVTKKRVRKKRIVPVELDIDFDPRRTMFASYYLDPMSNTFSNALQSAIKAGFTPHYAKSILSTKPKWLWDIVGRMDFMDTVKANIKKHLELKTITPVMTAFGPYIDKKTKKMLYQEDSKLLKLQQDMTMFVAEHLIDEFKKVDRSKKPEGDIKNLTVINQITIKSPDGTAITYNQKDDGARDIIDIETNGGLQGSTV